MATPSLEQKLEKIRSPNLQSQQQTAVVLNAVEATLKEHGTPTTSTGYFAALVALLNQSTEHGEVKKDLAIPVVYLLDVVAPFAPQPLLRAKFTQILSLLAPVLSLPDADAPLLRPSMGCLESLLMAQDAAAWAMSAAQVSPRRAVGGLLKLALDPRPKVRKRAQEALRKVLRSPPPSPSLDHPAAGMCAATAMQSLAELVTKTSQSKKGKKAPETSSDPELMHALQLVKTVASASGGWPTKEIEPLCELILRIARSANEHLTMVVFEIFEMIFEGMAGDEVSSSKLPRLLEIISELRPAANDTQLLPPWIAILSRGYDVSAQVEPEDTFLKLPELFTMVSQFLESHSKNIRVSASECLVSFMANCIPKHVLREPSIYDEKILEKLARVVESLLTVKYQPAWLETFNVVSAMFESLRWRAHPYLLGITKTMGEMRGNDSFSSKQEADKVLGQAIRAMGPEAVLSVLPLNLAKPMKGQPGRAWMLPLFRDYTANTNLAHFRTEFIPLSESMFQRVLDHGEAPKTMEIKIFETVVQQIWSILPAYCDLPLDLKEAFDQSFAELLANLLYQQVDLRLDICRALQAVVESSQAIVSIEDEEDLVLQGRISKDTARSNLEHLATFAGNFLAVLFNVYDQTSPQTRGPVLQTINTFLSITSPEQLTSTFEDVYGMIKPLLQDTTKKPAGEKTNENKEQAPTTGHTLMDLVITMSIYLPRESYGPLFEVASLALVRDDDPQLQKKAYKLIPRLAGTDTGRSALEARHGELRDLLVLSSEKVSAPARRERLAAIATLIEVIPHTSLHLIPTFLSEVVIGCKEHNERARTTAFEALVLMGHKMAVASGALIDNSKVPHMPKDAPAAHASIEEFFTMVSAGLAGNTPHMISASITAISRVLYEFRESLQPGVVSDLVQTMDLFLTSNNREIVKSVLGFVKICILSLPADMMQSRLQTLVPNLMVWSHDHKGNFRSKVKHILERMIRRFGVDAVNKFCPEEDKKLITNIRKTKERNKRKKDAAKEAGDDEEAEDQGEKRSGKRGGQFDNQYDQILYTSDESDESDDPDHDEITGKSKKARKGATSYIVEDPNEPLDLLGRNALASISTTKPVKAKRRTMSKAKVDMDGKLVLGQEEGAGDAMEVDQANDHQEEDGVGAYVAALKGRDVARRGQRGKLKFSNSRKNKSADDDEDDSMDVDDVASAIKAKAGQGMDRSRGSFRGDGRGGGRGRGGRAGKGGIAAGRRGLGVDKNRNPSSGGRVAKSSRGRR